MCVCVCEREKEREREREREREETTNLLGGSEEEERRMTLLLPLERLRFNSGCESLARPSQLLWKYTRTSTRTPDSSRRE